MVFWYWKCFRVSVSSGSSSRVEGGVCSNEQGPFAIDNIADHNDCPAKGRFLNDSALGLVPGNHAHSSLRVSIRCHVRLQAHHVVSNIVLKINLVCDIGLRQYH